MGFQELPDLDCTKTTALGGTDKKSGKKNPTSIEGYYIGTRQVVSPKSKTGFAALHIFQTKTGNVGVWGKTNLDQKMTAVTPGQMVRATFVGMVETKNNPMYKYKVEVDAENTIDVGPALEAAASEGDSESEPQYSDTDGGDTFSDEPAEDDLGTEVAPLDEATPARAKAPARIATTPDAARQRKVQDLLNGRGTRKATA